ncbi:MAG: 2-C-methyl-D-erythritol 4-phosphate cytidylyltransferase [Candidatus Wallbacteria bacterium]|nr:2-C-methyl-D-erythritol 4-phosphate cytidylyltransferase [Candidatus Wallbacteria bacterium]
MMAIAAIIVAAGSGTRLGGPVPKQFQDLCGVPVVTRAAWAFDGLVDRILVAVPAGYVENARHELFGALSWSVMPEVLAGGRERWESVARCLELLDDSTRHVLVHDGARPLVTRKLVRRVVDEVRASGAVIAALPERNTLKKVAAGGAIAATLDRADVWEAQTPQAFELSTLRAAYAGLDLGTGAPTDDSALVERLGIPVRVIEGEEQNLKITTEFDLRLARILLPALTPLAGGSPR